jgi:hypothetical protein
MRREAASLPRTQRYQDGAGPNSGSIVAENAIIDAGGRR